MKTYTYEEFYEWFASQPEDRPVQMNHSVVRNDHDCGCLMIEFARDHGHSGYLRAATLTVFQDYGSADEGDGEVLFQIDRSWTEWWLGMNNEDHSGPSTFGTLHRKHLIATPE